MNKILMNTNENPANMDTGAERCSAGAELEVNKRPNLSAQFLRDIIFDRLVYNAQCINLKVESKRIESIHICAVRVPVNV